MMFRNPAILIVLALGTSPALAADTASDVQRLQIDRDRQQADLRLKMQQQQERALRPPQDATAERRRGQLEREQVQRQQQLFEEQARGQSMPQVSDDAA